MGSVNSLEPPTCPTVEDEHLSLQRQIWVTPHSSNHYSLRQASLRLSCFIHKFLEQQILDSGWSLPLGKLTQKSTQTSDPTTGSNSYHPLFCHLLEIPSLSANISTGPDSLTIQNCIPKRTSESLVSRFFSGFCHNLCPLGKGVL